MRSVKERWGGRAPAGWRKVPIAMAVAAAIGGCGIAAAEVGNWTDGVTLTGNIEIEASFWDGAEENSNDVTLATVELGVDASINSWTEAHVLLLYEDGENDDNIAVDEATLRFGNSDVSPGYLMVGRMYVPFGRFDTMQLSDPLTLDVGETQEDAVQLGFEQETGLYGSVYLFNGNVDDGGNDVIEHFGANIGYLWSDGSNDLDVGVDWINSIGSTDGLDFELVDHKIDGVVFHAASNLGPVTLIGEYLAATENLDGPGTASKLKAYNLEVGYNFDMNGIPATAAVSYQRTSEADMYDLPEKRVAATLSMEVLENTSMGVEWKRETFYDGTDEDTATLQVAAGF